MDEKNRAKLAKLVEDNFDDLKWMIAASIEKYIDHEASGFVHTMPMSEYILLDLRNKYLIDPDVHASLVMRELLMEATLKARGAWHYERQSD